MKRKIALMCVMAMLFSLFGVENVYAQDNKGREYKKGITRVEKGKNIEHFSKREINETELFVLDEESYEKQDVDSMKEVLDNGTDILVSGEHFDKICNDFEIDYGMEFDENAVIVGYYLSSNGDEYCLNPIEYQLMVEEGDKEELSDEQVVEILEDIAETEQLDADLIYADVQSTDTSDIFSALSDEEKGELQTSTQLGSSFTDKSRFVYLYAKDANVTGPWYVYSPNSSYSGYKKIGSLRFLICGIKLKTVGNVTYDTIYTECTAGALNGCYVKKFIVGIYLVEESFVSIQSSSTPTNAASKTVSLATGVNGDGSISSSSSISYTYNPNSLTSIDEINSERYSCEWECVAPKKLNGSFKVCPSIVVKNNHGKTSAAVARVYVDYFQLKKDSYTYTMTSKSQIGIKFVNHAQY